MHASFSIAQEIMAHAGVGRYRFFDSEADPSLITELRLLGCLVSFGPSNGAPEPEASRDDVVLVALSMLAGAIDTDFDAHVARLRTIATRYVIVLDGSASRAPLTDDVTRQLVLTRMLQRGFRRALGSWTTTRSSNLGSDARRFLVLERCSAATDPVSSLRGPFDDLSRRSDQESDAYLARYSLCAEQVRPGDVVLDYRCGAGCGAALLSACSAASRVIGADRPPSVSAWSDFERRYEVDYRDIPDDGLPFLASHSVDFVAFLAAERSIDAGVVLDELERILKPDGRLVVSVLGFDGVNSSVSRSERATTRARWIQALSARFHLEVAYAGVLHLERIPLGALAGVESDAIVVCSARFEVAAQVSYRHPEFAVQAEQGVVPVDFGHHYDNPWIYRSLVQLGQRLQNEDLLLESCLSVLQRSRLSSADFGAAACVIAYHVLKRRDCERLDDLRALVDAYNDCSDVGAHARRWQTSLSFVIGLLCMMAGRTEDAIRYFERTLSSEPTRFSSLLATKSVAACYWAGVLNLSSGASDRARDWFEQGVARGGDALRTIDEMSTGTVSNPLPFAFQELAEVADMTSQCAKALQLLPAYPRSPARFWQQIDVRRFGLATWAIQLQRENSELRAFGERVVRDHVRSSAKAFPERAVPTCA